MPCSPVESGMILTNGTVLFSRDAGDSGVPFDLECKAACDANEACAMASSYVETARCFRARAPAAAVAARAAAAAAERAAAAASADDPPLKTGRRLGPGFNEPPEGDETEIMFRLKCGVENHHLLLLVGRSCWCSTSAHDDGAGHLRELARVRVHAPDRALHAERVRPRKPARRRRPRRRGLCVPWLPRRLPERLCAVRNERGAVDVGDAAPLRMARNVSMATCAAISKRTNCRAAVCGCATTTRTASRRRLATAGCSWARGRACRRAGRAFYEYARRTWALRLRRRRHQAGQFHTAYFEPCTDGNVCIKEDEFHLDDEETVPSEGDVQHRDARASAGRAGDQRRAVPAAGASAA